MRIDPPPARPRERINTSIEELAKKEQKKSTHWRRKKDTEREREREIASSIRWMEERGDKAGRALGERGKGGRGAFWRENARDPARSWLLRETIPVSFFSSPFPWCMAWECSFLPA
jgi:hypothetical protein